MASRYLSEQKNSIKHKTSEEIPYTNISQLEIIIPSFQPKLCHTQSRTLALRARKCTPTNSDVGASAGDSLSTPPQEKEAWNKCCIKHYRKLGKVWKRGYKKMCTQTDIHTNMVITILCSLTGEGGEMANNRKMSERSNTILTNS